MSAIVKAIPGVMSRFRITEVSGVTDPAQKGARACFIKNDSTQPPAGEVDWAAVATKAREALHELATVKSAKSGRTYEQEYADACGRHPVGAQLAMGR